MRDHMIAGRAAKGSVLFPVAARPPVLTVRQTEVLRLSALGMTAGQVAARLGITTQVVKNHLAVTYRRMDAHCLADALRAVGWLRVPA